MSKQGRILVAMSGGVDSTVTALLLHDAGYEVVGVTMKTWDYASSGVQAKETGCCSLDSINDARHVAVKWGFQHIILDIREEFNKHIVRNFTDEYLRGHTPNPCVLCNTFIKWDALLKRADQLDCAYIATGHYARVQRGRGRYFISKGKDPGKDQSYVLWGLSQSNLSRTLFPVGRFGKKEIKSLAVEYGLKNLAEKPESYEICFIPNHDYRSFLRNHSPADFDALKGGKIVTTAGEILGTHEGYPFFTIGQRRGLKVAAGEPLYVLATYPDSNTVVLGKKEELLHNAMLVSNVNLMKYEKPEAASKAVIKIRYRDAGHIGKLYPERDNKQKIIFEQPVYAITPGQSAVFYEGDDIIGGGIIENVLDENYKKEPHA